MHPRNAPSLWFACCSFFFAATFHTEARAQQLTLTVAPTVFTAGATSDMMLIVTNQGPSAVNIPGSSSPLFQFTVSSDVGTVSSVDSPAADGNGWSLAWLDASVASNVISVDNPFPPVSFPVGRSFAVHAKFTASSGSTTGPGTITLNLVPSGFTAPTVPYAAVAIVGFPTGPAGATGPTGTNGSNGATGATGATGPAGQTGSTGGAGAAGQAGSTGAVGPTGATGSTGSTGATGSTGSIGATGSVGPTGANGTGSLSWRGPWSSIATYEADDAVFENGSSYVAVATNSGVDPAADVASGSHSWGVLAQGAIGGTGPTGPAGAPGITGPTGAVGATGAQGAPGATGASGAQGTNGSTGAAGTAGPEGATGMTGALGATGPTGSNGAPGATGPAGPTGSTGAKGGCNSAPGTTDFGALLALIGATHFSRRRQRVREC